MLKCSVLLQEWGAQGAFPLLQTLWLSHNWLQSSLPPSWGLAVAFPKLKSLRLDRNRINGSLPEQWGSGAGFLNLQVQQLVLPVFGLGVVLLAC